MNLRRATFCGLAAAGLSLLLFLTSVGVEAQPAARTPRIGYLGAGSAATGLQEPLRQGLRELGWVEGQNLAIDFRFADGRLDRLPELAAELVRLKVDVIAAQPGVAAAAARRATDSIPIVMINVGDPVRLGLVASLARPGGNVTGTTFDVGLEVFGKCLELLKEAIPGLRRVGVLSNPDNPNQSRAVNDLKAKAHSLGLELRFVEARAPEAFDAAFGQMTRERVEAVFVVTDPVLILQRKALADLAQRHKLPSMYSVAENAEAGGMISYGPSLAYGSFRAAAFVDKILKGAKPADLPVEQPTRFELVVNLKTAKALGVTVPRPLLLRADRVIE